MWTIRYTFRSAGNTGDNEMRETGRIMTMVFLSSDLELRYPFVYCTCSYACFMVDSWRYFSREQ